MEFIKKIDWSKPGIQLTFVGLFGVFAFVVLSGGGVGNSFSGVMTNSKQAVTPDAYYAESDMGYAPELSVRNVDSSYISPRPEFAPGNDAEAYEVKDYNATIETRNLEEDCSTVRSLMEREDVIFQNKNEYEQGCSYSFKVAKDSVDEVLAILETLDPKDISENSYTIKREVADYTSEIEILEKKLATLDQTLTESLASYDSLSAQATSRGDVATLAQITDSKITLIERLTVTRIDTVAQLDRLSRAKSDSLDSLIYTNFYVNIYENTFVNREALQSSWVEAVKQLVVDVNTFAQEVSLGFVALLFLVVKYSLYGVVLLFVARFGYSFARKVWVSQP